MQSGGQKAGQEREEEAEERRKMKKKKIKVMYAKHFASLRSQPFNTLSSKLKSLTRKPVSNWERVYECVPSYEECVKQFKSLATLTFV